MPRKTEMPEDVLKMTAAMRDAYDNRDNRPKLEAWKPKPAPSYKEVSPVLTGFGRAGTGIMKALDLPNRLFGNTRSRLQDIYERADRNIELTRKRNPSMLDKAVEGAATLAGSAWAGRGLPLLFGASGGTDTVIAAEQAGADDPEGRGVRAAAVDTAIWSAAIRLGSKVLPTHLQWLSSYVTNIAKAGVSSAVRSAEYRDMGYDVPGWKNVGDSMAVAALIPMLGAVKDIGAQSYKAPGTGRSVSLSEFANKFQSRIKQTDRTTADAERIARDYVEMVEREPGRFVPKVSPEGKALQKFTGLLVQPFRNGQAEGRARMVDPDGKTGADAEAWANDDVRSWYQLYEKTLSRDELSLLRTLTGKDKLAPDEKSTMTELITRPARSDVHITGTDPHTGQYVDQTIGDFLAGLAEADTASRARSVGTLASFLRAANHYSPTEKALVLQAASTYGVRTGRNGRQLVSMDSTNTQQPTVLDDATVSSIVAMLREGVPIKKAMLVEPKVSSTGKRGVPSDFTGWKRFDRSNRPEDIAALQAACAGSKGRWCTGEGAAGSQLPYGDFHVHFTGGEPDVAIKMTGSRVDEIRGSDTGQRLFPKEAEIAETYIREQQDSGYQMTVDKGFWADQAFRRKLATDSVTWRDVWDIDIEKPSFAGAAGEMGAEDSWPPYAQKVIRDTLATSEAERHDAGYYLGAEVANAWHNGETLDRVRHIKGVGLVLGGRENGHVPLEELPNLESFSGGDISLTGSRPIEWPRNLHVVGGNLSLGEGTSAPVVTSVEGDLTLYEGASAPNVTSVGRNLWLGRGASAPDVTSVGGDLSLVRGASAPGVTSVGGNLSLHKGASAPGVTSVGRNLWLYKGASAPNVTSVGRNLLLREGASAPNVTSVGGDLSLYEGAYAPGVTSVGRDLWLYEGASAPGVTSVRGDLTLERGASAPGVTSVGKVLTLYKGASAPGVTSIGGDLLLYEGASAPGVTSVGGDLVLREGASAPDVTSVGRHLLLFKGASAPSVTSVGWLRDYGVLHSGPALARIKPKYGVLDREDRPVVHDETLSTLGSSDSPDFVRNIVPHWSDLDPADQRRIIQDSVNGFDESKRSYYEELLRNVRSIPIDDIDDAPFALKAGRTRRDVRAAFGGGDAGASKSTGVPSGHNPALDGYSGPRIVINPSTFKNKKDALCVAWNEGLRVFMEENGFDPQSEPTDRQRKFFSDTPYADDEVQLRRTILARIATFDTSVTDPTDEQLEETASVLDAAVESGFASTEFEVTGCRRLAAAVRAAVGAPLENREPQLEPAPAEPFEPGTTGAQLGGTAGELDAGLEVNEDFVNDKTLEEKIAFLKERGMDENLASHYNMKQLIDIHTEQVNAAAVQPTAAKPANPAEAQTNVQAGLDKDGFIVGVEKPGETAQAKPGETAQAKPGETAQAKPGETAQAKPGETAQAKPEDRNLTESPLPEWDLSNPWNYAGSFGVRQ